MKRLLAVLVGLALALVGTMAAAAWLSSGTVAVAVGASSLAAPTAAAGAPTAGTGDVHVSWAASTGSLTPTGYYVLRMPASGPAAPACASTPTSPVSGTSCTDTSVPLGTYTYVVVAVFHSWTRSSVPSAAVTVGKASQTITFTSSPTNPTFGGSYTVTATGGGSGNPVTFASSTTSVCTMSGAKVSFVHAGTCTVTADQAGSTYYDAAPQMSQTFEVAKASQTVAFTSAVPGTAVVGGPGYTPTATGGGSGNPVTFAIDPLTAGVCSITGGVVSYQHAGTCVIDAGQAGNADYAAAQVAQQSIAVGKGAQAVNITSTPPANAKAGGATYTVTATGGASGNPVTFSSADTSVCTVSGATVSFVGAGTCTINADQAGNSDYLAAPQAHQSFAVAAAGDTVAPSLTAIMDGRTSWSVGSNGAGSWNKDACAGNQVCATTADSGSPTSGIKASSIYFTLVGTSGTNNAKCWTGTVFQSGTACQATMTYVGATGRITASVPQSAMGVGGYSLKIHVEDNAGNVKETTATLTITN